MKNFERSWSFSYDKLKLISEELSRTFSDEKFSISIAGSYGRMEACSESDLDFFILFNETDLDKAATTEISNKVREIIKKLDIKLPNSGGVFSESVPITDLLNIGDEKDNLTRLAQRMLLLMESRAIYNEEHYKKTVLKILHKYLEFVIKDPEKEAVFLLNDLIKYFRSIAVNYQNTFWKDQEKWVIRNVKLRHSRILIYSGLLLLIMNSSKNRIDKVKYFEDNIFLTPIEKIISVYNNNNDYGYQRLLGAYDIFLGKIAKADVRSALQAEYGERYNNDYYAELKVTSDLFISELTRFIFKQKNTWTEKMYEYLLF